MDAPLPQQYCLRWNNHQHNLLSVFEDLLNHEAFVDVTLACDGRQLKAHKMVLSACSPYFQSMLYNTPDRHPIVFLRDVRYDEMKALLEFMYRGEVSVDQESLSSLLKVAEGLKIKGLAEVNDPAVTTPTSTPSKHLAPPSSLGGLLATYPGLMSPLDSSSPIKRSTSPCSYLPPKRKRGRPRRLSGSEAVPMAPSMAEASPIKMEEELNVKLGKGLREGSGEVSPQDTKPQDSLSEADSNDGRSSGLLTPKKEPASGSSWVESDRSNSSPINRSREQPADEGIHPSGPSPLAPGGGALALSPLHTQSNLSDPKALSEMSVRGLDLLRYAQIHSDGTYRCIECEKVQITKNFKNKYSFQRHAFLYHEGPSRKVFPCGICQKEFSRPDKMKQHLKQAHDCVIPKGAEQATPLPPSALLVNPFLGLPDPASTEGKIESLKDSGGRC